MREKTQNLLFNNKKLAALLIPLALDQLLNSFMGSVDTFMVSHLGSASISAVSLVDSINGLRRNGGVFPLSWLSEEKDGQ